MKIQKQMRVALGSVTLVMLSLLTSACGGGGGTTDVKPVEPPAVPSLVPAAPALGATLFADATQLRPLVVGMRADFDGRQGSTLSYSNSIVVESSTDGLQETEYAPFGDSTTKAIVKIADGQVRRTEAMDVGVPGPVETVSWTELRSPVRVGDQQLVFERNGVDSGRDVDGDKISDKVDAAAWSRVIGMEDVELPALKRTVSALRLDVTMALRIHRSSDKGTEPIQFLQQSRWYAPGIGLVRQALTDPGKGEPGPMRYDERLRSWDGQTRGLGGFVYTRDAQPGLFTGHPALSGLALGGRALVLSGLSDDSGEQGLRLSVFDAGGRLLGSTALPQFKRLPNARAELLRCGAFACLVLSEAIDSNFGNFPPYQARLLRFDANGQVAGPAAGRVLELGDVGEVPNRLLSAGSGSGFWLLWPRPTAPSDPTQPVELSMQSFDAEGTARTSRLALETSRSRLLPLSLTSTDDHAIASWAVEEFPQMRFKMASLTSNGAAALATFASTDVGGFGRASGSVVAQAIDATTQALLWSGSLFDSTGAASPGWKGAALTNAVPLPRSTAGSLDNEQLPTGWTLSDRPLFASQPGRLLLISRGLGRLDGSAVSDTDLLQLTQLSLPPATPLVKASNSQTVTIPMISSFVTARDFYPSVAVALSDRVLLFAASPATVGLIFTAP